MSECDRCGREVSVRKHFLFFDRWALCVTCDEIFKSQLYRFMRQEIDHLSDFSDLPLFKDVVGGRPEGKRHGLDGGNR